MNGTVPRSLHEGITYLSDFLILNILQPTICNKEGVKIKVVNHSTRVWNLWEKLYINPTQVQLLPYIRRQSKIYIPKFKKTTTTMPILILTLKGLQMNGGISEYIDSRGPTNSEPSKRKWSGVRDEF